jgi:hypothetical protein
MTTPTSQFNVFVPVTFSANQIDTYFYIGYQKTNPSTGKKSLVYIEPMRKISINTPSSVAGEYGPVVTTALVGQTVSNLGLRAKVIGALPTANTATNIGASYSYFSEWDYIKDSSITGWETYG